MKTIIKFLSVVALVFTVLGLFGSGASFAQNKQKQTGAKTKTVEALIEKVNPDAKVITIDGYPGTITYNKSTVFVAAGVEVSPSAVREGIKVTITYTESLGKEFPLGSGIRPVSGIARRIVLDIPIEKAQQLPETPKRFVDNGDGTITDTKTKLMWQKNDDGKKRTWKEVQDYVRTLRLAGHTDWRLPEAKDHDKEIVLMLMGKTRSEGTVDYYWSNERGVWLPFNYPATHLDVGLGISLGEPKETDRAFVRCVRQLK